MSKQRARWNVRVGRRLLLRRSNRLAQIGLRLVHHDNGVTRLPVCALSCDCHGGWFKWPTGKRTPT
jgi:hypothetical protein